jgi:glycosyl transferase, family 25
MFKKNYSNMKIYVISLPSALERRQFMDRQLKALGLGYELVDAINGRELTSDQEEMVDRNWKQRRKGEGLSPGSIGCSLSHAFVYKKILSDGVEQAIILEDDAVLLKGFVDVANGLLDGCGVPLVVLHAYPRCWATRKRWRINNAFSLYSFYGRPLGTCGYFLTSGAASRLLEAALPVYTVADWPMNVSTKLGARGIEPTCVGHGEDLFSTQIQHFSNRRIPLSFRIMRLLLLPCIICPGKFGSFWKSLYAWQAIYFHALARFRGVKPVQGESHAVPAIINGL